MGLLSYLLNQSFHRSKIKDNAEMLAYSLISVLFQLHSETANSGDMRLKIRY